MNNWYVVYFDFDLCTCNKIMFVFYTKFFCKIHVPTTSLERMFSTLKRVNHSRETQFQSQQSYTHNTQDLFLPKYS